MIHKATDLIPGWYNDSVNKEVLPDELALRRKAINDLYESEDVALWIKLLKVYLNNAKFGSSEYSDVLEHVKKGDDNFAIQNENLTQTIAGCAIAQKMEDETSYISDIIAAGLLTTEILPSAKSLIPELRNRAIQFWIKESEIRRQVDTEFMDGTKNLKSLTKVELPAVNLELSSMKAHSDAILKVMNSLQKDINATDASLLSFSNSLNTIKANFKCLSEETNILWWLFGAYSSTLKKPFKRVSAELLTIVIALELAELTLLLPSLGNVDSIIARALASVEFEVGSTTLIEAIIDSIVGNEVQIKQYLPKAPSMLSYFTPLIYAIYCRTEYSGAEWKAVYAKHSELNVSSKMSFENFASQLYKEIMLVKLFETIKQ
jgi:hypothetical protein